MAYTPKRIYTGQPDFNGTATLYTSVTAYGTIIKAITATNTTSTSATFSLSVVPYGGSVSTSNQIISSLPLPGNATITFENIAMLNTGDLIVASQGTTGAISLHIYGVEVS